MDNPPNVLVVDDEERNCRLLEAMLAPWGYEVTVAHDGVDALEKTTASPPDVILLDVMMPGMDGLEVARRLKQDDETKIIPIVMVTSLADVQDRVRAMDAGADDFLSKPVDKTELQARVASLLKVKAYNDHLKNYQQELEAEVAKRTEELREAFEKIKGLSLETVHRLSRAAEYKDEDTGAHVQRMSNYAAAVTRQMGLSDDTVATVLYASPMHDVGKIGIPDRILLKPGKLDPEEWRIMKQHAEMGAGILEGSEADVLKVAQAIAMTHHEKWDGSGYPKGLKGKEIPMVGRITAIADVFDALTTKRPYKEAFPLEKAYGIIEEGRESHFDPEVTDAFFAVRDEILTIKERYQNEGESPFLRLAGQVAQWPK